MSKDSIEIVDEQYVWEWRDYSWHRFDKNVSDKIEDAYKTNPEGETTVAVGGYQDYKITFSDMNQENLKTKYRRQVRRVLLKKDSKKVDVREINKFYKLKKTTHEDEYGEEVSGIDGEGIMEFAKLIGVDPMSIDLMVLFWKLNCKIKYFVTENEFIYGLANLGMETFTKLKKGVPKLKDALKDDEQFKVFYLFCFNYMKEPGQKRINVEFAVPTLKLVLDGKYKYLSDWCDFLENNYKQSLSLDTWKLFLTFISDPDFKDFESFEYQDQAYPVAVDEFIEYMRRKLNPEKYKDVKESHKEKSDD